MFYEMSSFFFKKLNEGNVVLGNNYIPIFTLDIENFHREILEDFGDIEVKTIVNYKPK